MSDNTKKMRLGIEVNSLVGAHAMVHVFYLFFTPLLPLIATQFGLNYQQTGLLVTVCYGAYGLAGLPAGLISDRLGGARTAAMALGIASLGALISGLATGLGQLTIGMVLMGMGAGFYHPAGFTTLAHVVPQAQYGKAMGIHGIGGNIGSAVGPLVTGVVLLFTAWQGPFIFWAVPGLLVAGALFRVHQRHSVPQTKAAEAETAAGSSFHLPTVVFLVLLLAGLHGLFTTTVFTYLPTFLQDVRGQMAATSSFWVTSLYAVGVGGQMLGGWLTDHRSRRAPLLWGGSAAAVGLFLLIRVVSPVGMIALFILLGFSLFAIQPPMTAILADVVEQRRRGFVFGLLFVSQFGSGALAPLLGGVMAQTYGLQTVFLLGALVAGLSYAGAWLIPPGRTVVLAKPGAIDSSV